MKKLLFTIFAAILATSAYADNRWYRLTFCTTVSEIDYCNEHAANVKFNFDGKRVLVTRYDDIIYDMTTVGKWKRDPSTGDSSITVSYNNTLWTLTAKEKSYTLDDHKCSSAEFWHGSRKSQRRQHGYIQTELDDVFLFTGTCYDRMDKRKRKMKNKINTDNLILGVNLTKTLTEMN